MPLSTLFTQATDWSPLHREIHDFGDADGAAEDDLVAALHAVRLWPQRFADAYTFEYRGEQITRFHKIESADRTL